MNNAKRIGRFRHYNSPDTIISPKVLGMWPGTVYIAPATPVSPPAPVAPSITLLVSGISGSTIGDISTPSGGESSWTVAGVSVRLRNTGTIPTGLNANTTYYLSLPSATTISFHTTKADALAGTNAVAMSGSPTGSLVIYANTVPDVSGNGRDLVMGSLNNDLTFYAAVNLPTAVSPSPWVGGASSGSNQVHAGLLDISGFKSQMSYPECSWFMAARLWLSGTVTLGRSVWGCGVSGSLDGPRLNVDSSTATKLSAQMYRNGGSAVSLGTSAADCLNTAAATAAHILFAVDGPENKAFLYVNGSPDLTVFNKDMGNLGSISLPNTIYWGGAATNNAQGSNWSEMMMAAMTGSLPNNMGSIAAFLASQKFARLTTKELP